MIADDFTTKGKYAIVTGGSRGLGLHMAEALLLAGAAKVYISSRKEKACAEAAKYLNDVCAANNLSGRAEYIAADLGTREGNEALAAEYRKREGDKLDILVSNAGATWGADLDSHPDKAFAKVMDLNVRGVFAGIQLFHGLLEKNGTQEDPSRIIVTGSIAGIRSGMSGGTYGYLASKAAIHHLAKSLAVELGPHNITVNILAPGFFPSKMADGLIEALGDEVVESNPRRRLGVKEDIMDAVVYLCSKAGNYLNGVVLPLDGGAHLSSRI